MRVSFMLGLLGAVGLMTFAGCSAIEKEDAASSEDAIQGGEEDTTHKFAVGLSVTSGKSTNICTGVLIAPNLVLTAQHCISSATGGVRVDCKSDKFAVRPTNVSGIKITTDARIPGRNSYAVSDIVVPTEQELCGADIALLILSKNVPATEAKPAVPLVKTPMTARDAISGKIAAIGYGLSGPDETDSGTRRIKERIAIACIPGDATADCAKKDLPSDSRREFQTTGGVCRGDSGSGAYDQATLDSGKDPVVLGILSRITMQDDACTDAIYTRTDMYARLIIATAVSAAEKGNYPTPRWAMPGDGSDAGPLDEGDVADAGDNGSSGDGTDAGTKKKGGFDWGKILDWVDDWLPPLLGSDDGKRRPDSQPSPTPDAGTDGGKDGGTDAGATTPPPPPSSSNDDVPPGGDRQTEDSTDSSESSGDKEKAKKKKDAKDDGGCRVGGHSRSPDFAALAIVGLAAAIRRRRERKA